MRIIADLHLHSRYSRATSGNSDLEGLSEWAQTKGIGLLGSADFTHPKWLGELKRKLKDEGEGIFSYKNTKFMLTTEVSNIFYRNNVNKKVHNILFAPSLEVVEQIGEGLKRFGKLEEDGRPMLNMDVIEMMEILRGISREICVVPAHCLPPDERINTINGSKKISEVNEGELVLTHKGRYKKVLKKLKRKYAGKTYRIKPYYFTAGTETTPEHPFYVIKSAKNPCVSRDICKPTCTDKNCCRRKFYEKYEAGWMQAKDIEVGDILVFPILRGVKDAKEIRTYGYIGKTFKNSRVRELPEKIPVSKDFCRLVGYYLAEGYNNGRDALLFCFNANEDGYIADVKRIIESIFGLKSPIERKRGNGVEITYYSKYLMEFFSNFCYGAKEKRAHTKCLPSWMLTLPQEKQAEIFLGWWRGDTGYTNSHDITEQMKAIMLRLGIVPTIFHETKEVHNSKRHYFGDRKIEAKHDGHSMRPSFFNDKYGLAKDPVFKKFRSKLARRHGWIDGNYLYVPVREIEVREYNGEVFNFEVEGDNSYVSEAAAVHNCWTPWFGVFGSKSGFNSLEEAFGKYAKDIFALETGLSSDPSMNWMLSSLDRISLISNSDCHSPQKLGREANVFEMDKITYKGIVDAIRTRKGFVKTYEFYPEEGKYHWDGHRECKVRMAPGDAIKMGDVCPVCKKKMTIGVLHRVEVLADRKEGFVPPHSVPFTRLIPLMEIIASVRDAGVATKGVQEEYFKIVNYFGNEFAALEAPEENLILASDKVLAKAIVKARNGEVYWKPGYDGEFGEMRWEKPKEDPKSQKSLMDF
jgi:uncharacterized protein (TIGR00375 family)